MQRIYYPITHAQKRIWYTEQFYPGTSVSNLSGLAKLKSNSGIDDNVLSDAIRHVVRSNESMRLRLELDEGGEPRQYVADYEEFDIEWLDVRQMGDRMSVMELAQAEARRPMALYESNLFHFAIFKISSSESWLLAKIHHVISDGISTVLLGNQIIDNYLELEKGNNEPQAMQPSYTDYIASELDYELSERFQKDRKFWNAQFESVPEVVSLKRNESQRIRTEAIRYTEEVSPLLHQKVQEFCKENSISVLSLFLSILHICMCRITGQDEGVIGTFMGNRTNAKEKQMLGMFVSTVPVKVQVDETLSFLAFARQIMKDQLSVIRHQKYPYNKLVGDLREKHGNVSRLFGISLEYQVMQWTEKENLSYLIEPLFCGHEVNDISIHVKDRWDTGTLLIDMDYRSELFRVEEISDFFRRMMYLLEGALEAPDTKIINLEWMPEEEKQRLLTQCNENEVYYDRDLTLHSLFEQQAAITPEQAAVVYEDEQITYKELNERSERLGQILQRKGVGPDTPVAILMERSEWVTVAILGVLKAGGAYVPIDPGFPEERIRFIIEDSGAHAVITEQHLAELYDLPKAKIVLLDNALLNEEHEGNLISIANARNLAYIIYTSGTTGKPKGVMIEHRQVHHLIEGLRSQVYARYDTTLNVALLAPFHFDASVQQLFASLILGHTLFIIPKSTVANGRSLTEYYRNHCIDITDGTPAHLKMIVAADDLQGVKVRHMLIGGEALPRVVVGKLFDLFAASGQTPVITNVYGPTESCVDASAYEIIPSLINEHSGNAYVPIGKPLGNNRFYILDAHGRLQPAGVEGELYIAGEGVGRGYLNLPELTSEKYVADPFVSGEKIFRSGDMARWLPDGNVEFVGRIDDQVKIRGYRIELGEIESVVLTHPSIGKAIVLARPADPDEWEICAYIVWKDAAPIVTVAELREYLSVQLPDYMLPSYFINLEEIPLTSSGKVDRKALFRHEAEVVSGTEYAAPSNELQEQLVQIWQEVLGTGRIGIYDNFFERGGHSLKAMILLSRIHKLYEVEMPLHVLFETPTVYALAEYIRTVDRQKFESILPVMPREFYPLSFAQQRVYVVSQFEHAGIGYNMPATALLEGRMDVQRMEQAFRELIQRHEALRTSFLSVNGVPMQKVHDQVPFEIMLISSDDKPVDSVLSTFVRPFDIKEAPLIRLGLVKMDENKHMLLFDMHHLISDGVSIGILWSELAQLYGGGSLPELHLQYKDYAVWQSRQVSQGFQKEEDYWVTALSGELPVLQLLTDRPRPPVQSFEGDRVSIVLDRALTKKLNRLAENNRTTLYMVLLGAYYTMLARYTGQEDIVIGTPTAGRNHANLEGIVGMFINTLALRMKVNLNSAFAELLQVVHSNVLNAFENQNYPFEWLVEKLNLPRDLSRNPIFDTMFILQNSFGELSQMGGMQLTVQETNFHIAKFDLTLQAKEERGGIVLDMDYSTRLFRKDTIERMLRHYQNLLEGITADPMLKLVQYNLFTEEEKHQLLNKFNPPATSYPKRQTVVQLFEEQVVMSPDRTALAFEGISLTYAELNGKANQMARTLQSKGMGSGGVCAMLVDRSVEMIVGILAILKAGAAYVPIDPEHPELRIKHFLTDSGASVLLTQKSLAPLAANVEFAGVYVLADDEDLYHGDASNLEHPIDPGHLANLTYTSGTTGTPKGNMVTHANIIRTVRNTNYMEIVSQDIVLSLSNYVFDAFMFDAFGALLNGAKLVVIPKHIVLDISRLPHVIEREHISILMITTALFNMLVDIHTDCIGGIRKVLFGGERASVEHVRKALKVAGKGKLLHMYGPSESTVFATYYQVEEVDENAVAIPIGQPVSNTTAYILDSFGQPQPIGAAGELCVGGDGLVLGYFNRPELTAEKFVAHPFAEEGLIYRTGDLARWLPDGQIEFIGRMDHQVKIRGQRIELGEIEHQLLRHESIREATVLALDTNSGEKRICAYIVAELPLLDSELREYAARDLPAYMVPSLFIQLKELPLTGNGKVDRRALPQPDFNFASNTEYVQPRNDTQARLAEIWQEILGLERVGLHDNFFEIGGHSLKAMAVLARIHQDMNVELPLKDLFQSPTIEALAQVISETEENEYTAIAPVEARDVYPVSSSQRRLYVLQQLEGLQQSYNMPSVLRLEGALHRERFETAFKELASRHEAMRTSFEMVEGTLVQRINKEANVIMSYFEATENEADSLIHQFIRPFALHESPLFRTALIKTGEETYLWLVDMHHIISDGTSVNILIEEMMKLYAGETLDPLRIQYKDYAVWQESFLGTEGYLKQEAYWLEQLAGELPVLNLPADYVRPAVQSFEGDRIQFSLDAQLTQALRKLAQETGTTMYMMLMALYVTFLARLSGQSDIIVGSPIAGRQHADLARIIGMFVNTLVIRTNPEGEKTFTDYLQEVKLAMLGAYECQDYPFEELVGKVQTQRDMSRNPLFDAAFAMQNADLKLLTMEGIRMETYPFEHKAAKFDLTLTAAEERDLIRFEMEYNTALFKPETMERWVGHFKMLMTHILKEPDVKLAEASMLTEEEKNQILVEFNDTKREYPSEKTIHELFEEQADRVPGNVAVVWGGQEITYLELNARANRLARTLKSKGVQPDSVVGIMVEQSIDMVVGILAILKAGGAYLPIDPEYPEDRVRYLIADSGTEFVLTQRQFTERLQGAELLYIEDSILDMVESTNLEQVNRPEDLAYVIYTSGSTGKPKGVMVEHRNVVRLVKNAGYIPFDETTRMAQTGAISFDASTFELFGALLHGGALYPVPRSILLDIAGFTQFLQQYPITVMWLTSPLFNQLVQENAGMFRSLQHLIIGGDALVPRHVNRVRRDCPGLALWNGYGPTENTTFSTCYLIEKEYCEPIPIGKPIGNSTTYIVNSQNHLQPIGVHGELYVGGDGVARGYFHRPDLTKDKFIDNPFVPGERMYRTGDLARWLPDGNIEFLGRVDQQVKVRGFRIELGEIESQLMQLDGVKEAVVITRQEESGQTSLCAYIHSERELLTGELREALSRSLPGYMIPSYFVQVERMPLTPNGKIDRRALPEPDIGAGREAYMGPRNEKEELLCLVWHEVLGVKQVGISDNFFSLGGDSIKAIQMAARLNKYGWKLEMKDLFQHPTIEQASSYLEQTESKPVDQGAVVGEAGLTPIQRWFFERHFTDMHHWNQSVMLHAPSGFNPLLVKQTLGKLIEHHDALRMAFTMEEDRIVQYNRAPEEVATELEVIPLDVPVFGLEQAVLHEAERIQSSIDLSQGCLLKAAIFQTAEGDHLLIVIHHLVVDGVSWRIMLEDFAAGYLQAAKGEAIIFHQKTNSYAQWASELEAYANSKPFLKERDYWGQLENTVILPLPKDYKTEDHRMHYTRTVEFSLTPSDTEHLITRVHEAYRTEMNDILLSALGFAVKEWTGSDQVMVNLEGHGREEIMENMNISRTVGWFTSQYPVLLDMKHSAELPYQIKRIKEDLRRIPNKGIGYSILRYLTADQHKDGLSFSIKPEISFNYLGQFTEMDESGVFVRSSLPMGSPLSPDTEKLTSIDIVGFIEGGILSMAISYNSLEYEEQTIAGLSQSFKRYLLRLIEHCLNKEGSEMTPSDLGDDELTLDELDQLLQIY